MLPVGLTLGEIASGMGFLAASIAVCGFLGQAWPALIRREDPEVRSAMVVGGLIGLFFAGAVIAASRMGW